MDDVFYKTSKTKAEKIRFRLCFAYRHLMSKRHEDWIWNGIGTEL